MKQQIEDLIEEQSDLEPLIIQLCNCATDEDMLHTAHKIVAKRQEYEWLKTKLEQLFKENK
jgi:hypothetical protein